MVGQSKTSPTKLSGERLLKRLGAGLGNGLSRTQLGKEPDRNNGEIQLNSRESRHHQRNRTVALQPLPMNKQISRVWSFASDSNPNIEYETLQYLDGSTSCNCKGWTRRLAADGSRSCKHTRYVDMGIADNHCTATHNYEPQQPKQQPQIHHAKHQQCQVFQIPKLGHRKFAI